MIEDVRPLDAAGEAHRSAAYGCRHAGRASGKVCPDALKDFVEAQVQERGFGTSSEYVRELIRHEQAMSVCAR